MSIEQAELDRIVERLRRQRTDDADVEAKSRATKLSADVWESVSAFANTSGGLLLLGLSERDRFEPVADFAIGKVLDAFVDGMGDGSRDGGKLRNPPRYTVGRGEVSGRPVLTVRIDENEPHLKPCSLRDRSIAAGSYKRVDDKDIRLSPTELYEMESATRFSSADREPVPDATEDDLDTERVQRLIADQQDRRVLHGVTDRSQQLRRLNITDAAGGIRMAALLALGTYPQQFYPRLVVDVAVHPTSEKSSATHQMRFLDRKECEGPLAEMLPEAVAVVARNLRTHSVVVGSGRQDLLEIPEEVLREAIANALLHREYDNRFVRQPVAVDVFPDRVEVTSPGGLWGGVTIDTIGEGQSRCRNDVLLKMLQRVPLSNGEGVAVEGNGSGVPLMNDLMDSRALARPDYSGTRIDFVKVVLQRHGAEVPEIQRWLAERMPRPLSPHEAAAVLVIHQQSGATIADLRSELGRASDDLRLTLASLADARIVRVNDGRYTLADQPDTPTGVDLIALNALSPDAPMSIHELADATDRSPNTLRPILRRLIDAGRVQATAPPTSRHRRYIRVE